METGEQKTFGEIVEAAESVQARAKKHLHKI